MTSEWPVIRPQSAEITTSNSQAVLGRCRDVELPSHTLFELPYPVARDGQVRVFAILQTNVQRSSGERRDFLDPLYVHDSAPVDAEKFLWVEFLFQFRNRVLIVGRGKNYYGLARQSRQDLEAIEAWHLNI